jgi:hypothetical protein
MTPTGIDFESAEGAPRRIGQSLEGGDQRESIGPFRRCIGGQGIAHDQGCSCGAVDARLSGSANRNRVPPWSPAPHPLRRQRRRLCWRPGSNHTDRPGSGTVLNSRDRTRAEWLRRPAPGRGSPGADPAAPSQPGVAGPYDPRRRAGKSGRHVVRLRDGAGMMTQVDRPQAADRRSVWRHAQGPRAGRGLPWE